jgi:hypothetical protein
MIRENETFTGIVGNLSKIAINGFHHRRSHDEIQSIQGVANQPQILTRRWEYKVRYCSRALESAQRVDAGRRF